NTYIYAFYNYASYTTPPSGYPATVDTIKYNVIDSVDMTGTTGTAYLYNYMGYGGFDSTEVCYNVLRNVWTSLTATNYVYTYIYGYYGQKLYKSVGNRIENVTGNAVYCYNYLGMYASHVDSNVVENIVQGVNNSTTGAVINYLGYYNDEGYTCSNNRINNISMVGGYCQTYMGYYGSDADVHHN